MQTEFELIISYSNQSFQPLDFVKAITDTIFLGQYLKHAFETFIALDSMQNGGSMFL